MHTVIERIPQGWILYVSRPGRQPLALNVYPTVQWALTQAHLVLRAFAYSTSGHTARIGH